MDFRDRDRQAGEKGWAGQKEVGVDASNLTHASIISCLLKCYKPGGNAVSWIV